MEMQSLELTTINISDCQKYILIMIIINNAGDSVITCNNVRSICDVKRFIVFLFLTDNKRLFGSTWFGIIALTFI